MMKIKIEKSNNEKLQAVLNEVQKRSLSRLITVEDLYVLVERTDYHEKFGLAQNVLIKNLFGEMITFVA